MNHLFPNRTRSGLFVILGLLAAVFPIGRVSAVVAPVNVDFEKPFIAIPAVVRNGRKVIHGVLPRDWKDNSGWADVEVTYSRAPGQGVAGSTALRVDIARIASGRG